MTHKKTNVKDDTKKMFFKKGTCSQVFFYILNREFGNQLETQESAADPLAGGIWKEGYQCGMLWGSSLAVGAESFRRSKDRGRAIGLAITATQHLVESFSKRTKTVDCSDITETDWTSKLSMAKYAVTGKFMTCFNLAEKWAPEAIESATEGLAHEQSNLSEHCTSCASEVAKKMGATDEEMVMVAGFAGGLGLSGNGCGALSAAIWMRSLITLREEPGKKPGFRNPGIERTIKAFYEKTDYEMLCKNITKQDFKTIKEHTEYIKNGGCKALIQILAES